MSEVYNPTYYGPVPVREAPGYSTIDSQTQGTIMKLVAQPNNEAYPSVDGNGVYKFTEIYKGPTTLVRDLPTSKMWPGRSRDEARLACGDVFVDRFNPPALPSDRKWYIETCIVRQNTQGDTSEIKITYIAKRFDSGGEGFADVPKEDTWALQWQPYSVSPYAFCANSMKPDKKPTEEAQSEDTASRYNIEQFFKQPKADISGWTYQDDKYQTKVLNEAEREIAKKVITNTNCQWHYPIVIHNSAQETNLSVLSAQPSYPKRIDKIDYITSDISGLPFSFEQPYTWVKIDDSLDAVKTNTTLTYKRSEKWMGTLCVDINYYGATQFDHAHLSSCRWELGKV